MFEAAFKSPQEVGLVRRPKALGQEREASGKKERNFIDWRGKTETRVVDEKDAVSSRSAIRGRFFRLMDGPEVV